MRNSVSIGRRRKVNVPENYAQFTALLPHLCDELSKALRDKQWDEARLINETIRRKTMSVEAWLNWNVANSGDTA